MSKTKHLDTALSILKDDGKARRSRGGFVLTITGDHGVLQTPRGKTMGMFYGNRDKMIADARAKVEKAVPGYGKNMEVFDVN